MKRTESGFTLIELLIVVVLIAILAAIAVPNLYGTKERSFVAAMQSDLRNLQTAQEAYFSGTQRYTSNLSDLSRLFFTSPGVSVTIDSASASGWGATATHSATNKVCTVAVSRAAAGTPVCP